MNLQQQSGLSPFKVGIQHDSIGNHYAIVFSGGDNPPNPSRALKRCDDNGNPLVRRRMSKKQRRHTGISKWAVA